MRVWAFMAENWEHCCWFCVRKLDPIYHLSFNVLSLVCVYTVQYKLPCFIGVRTLPRFVGIPNLPIVLHEGPGNALGIQGHLSYVGLIALPAGLPIWPPVRKRTPIAWHNSLSARSLDCITHTQTHTHACTCNIHILLYTYTHVRTEGKRVYAWFI